MVLFLAALSVLCLPLLCACSSDEGSSNDFRPYYYIRKSLIIRNLSDKTIEVYGYLQWSSIEVTDVSWTAPTGNETITSELRCNGWSEISAGASGSCQISYLVNAGWDDGEVINPEEDYLKTKSYIVTFNAFFSGKIGVYKNNSVTITSDYKNSKLYIPADTDPELVFVKNGEDYVLYIAE